MSFDSQRLFELLPTVHRLRDADGSSGTKTRCALSST